MNKLNTYEIFGILFIGTTLLASGMYSNHIFALSEQNVNLNEDEINLWEQNPKSFDNANNILESFLVTNYFSSLTGYNQIGFGGFNSGTGNWGLFNSGTGNFGFGNSGSTNTSLFNSGDNNIGFGIIGIGDRYG